MLTALVTDTFYMGIVPVAKLALSHIQLNVDRP